MTSTALRTPGISFTVVPPPTRQALPRMDIAGFVGFAASGPVDTPVPVEDPGAYAALFGEDLRLVRDEKTGNDVYCNLGPAVRSFFANGGRRCWVVRVALDPSTGVIQLPGVVTRTADGSLLQGSLAARSAGSWADEVRISAALGSEVIAVSSATMGPEPQLVVPAASDLGEGDLIRLTAGEQMVMMVLGKDAKSAGPRNRQTRTVNVKPESILFVRDAVAGAGRLPAPGTAGTACMPSLFPAPPDPSATLAAVGEDTVTITMSDALSPEAGQYLLVQGLLGPQGEDLWVLVDDVHVDPSEPSSLIVEGAAQFVTGSAGPEGPFNGAPTYAERLTMDLFAQAPGAPIAHLAGLGFAYGHPSWVGLLPSDEQLYNPIAPSPTGEEDDAVWGAPPTRPLWGEDGTPPLWTKLTTPRFAVAAAIGTGMPLLGPISYPLAMPVVETHWLSPPFDPTTDLVRNGLEHFDSRLFVEDDLRRDLTTDLLADADSRSLASGAPATLHGLHSLLYNDEVTLLSVPDATQRGWSWELAKTADWLPQSPAFVLPPQPGAFTDCATRELPAPRLSRPVPGLVTAASPPVTADGDVFTLTWSAVPVADPTYVLQQAVDPTFAAATTYYEGSQTSVAIYALDAGQEPGAGTFFRVRAFAGNSRSNWSNTVQLVAGPRLRAVQLPVDAYSSATMIDVHRALLRAAAARGDLFAVMALPSHYDEQQTRAHTGQLETALVPAPDTGPPLYAVPPLPQSEGSTYSYGALYHPWVVIVETDGSTTTVPPDGPAVGVLSAVAAPLGSTASLPPSGPATENAPPALVGAWMSPGNIPLAGAVELTPELSPTLMPPGAVPRVNVLSQVPIGFVSLSAWTMSTNSDLDEINVRRLLCELRRMATLLGPRYVFEPNGSRLAHAVTRDFESLLTQLFTAGAFAGATPATSYFLSVRTGADPTSGLDRAQLRVQIGVAPSVPLRFLSVQLTQEAGGTTQVGGS